MSREDSSGLRGSGQYILGMATAPQGSCVGSVDRGAAGGKHLEKELQCGQGPCLWPQCGQEAAGTLPSGHEVTTPPTSRHLPVQGCNPCLAGMLCGKPFSHCSVALGEAALQAPQKLILPVSQVSTPHPLPVPMPLPTLCLHFPFCLECPLQPFHPPLPVQSSSTGSLRGSLEAMP